MSKHGELKRAAIQRKNELEHFGIPGTFQIDPDAFLSILAELEVSNNVGRALGDTIGSVCDSRDALVRANEQLKTENELLKKRIDDMSPFKGAPFTGQDPKCLACGGYHYGMGGLPCPSMRVTAQADLPETRSGQIGFGMEEGGQ